MKNILVSCVLMVFSSLACAAGVEPTPFIHAAKPDWQSSANYKRVACLKAASNEYAFLRYHGKTDQEATVIVRRWYFRCLTQHGVAI